jgi:uncharacterized membrane protein YeaQ/YmgE (transglycosylase-associated protein family)
VFAELTAQRTGLRQTNRSAIMGLIAFILLGIVAGYLGRLLMPGKQPMGFFATAGLGMLGSVVGGTIASLITGEGLALSTAGIIGSILGVILVLFIAERVGSGSGDRARA